MNFKKNIIITLTIIFISLFAVATFNYTVDPAQIFHKDNTEQNIADIIIKQQKNVVLSTNLDDRLIQKHCIVDMQTSPSIIALGSSRIMQLQQATFASSFFNNGVAGASLEDILAIYFMYEDKDNQPQTIIIAVEPWLLNKNNDQTRWKSISQEYDKANNILQNKHATKNSHLEKYGELISLPYLREAIKRVLHKTDNQKIFYATDDIPKDSLAKLKDGSVTYPISSTDISSEEIDKLATEYANTTPIYSLGKYSELDVNLQEQFENFIHYLKQRNKEIIFFFPPYHPIPYKVITNKKEYENVLKAQTYFKNFALANNIKIIGSYDPQAMQLTSKDFFDGMHMQEKSINKLFQTANIIQNP